MRAQSCYGATLLSRRVFGVSTSKKRPQLRIVRNLSYTAKSPWAVALENPKKSFADRVGLPFSCARFASGMTTSACSAAPRLARPLASAPPGSTLRLLELLGIGRMDGSWGRQRISLVMTRSTLRSSNHVCVSRWLQNTLPYASRS